MEITPVPQPAPALSRGRVLAALLVLGPVIVLVFLPSVMGLQRYVVTDAAMAGDVEGSIGRGSVALTRNVPVADLVAGDVIVFRPPVGEGAAGEDTAGEDTAGEDTVTRRIVAIEGGAARTRGDNRPAEDPWQVDVTSGTYPRVVFAVPWIGRPFSGQAGQGGWWLLAGAIVMTLALAVAAPWRRARQRDSPPRAGPIAGAHESP